VLADLVQVLGARLRDVRQREGLSLQRVEQRSGGRWKAVVVGSYERGDRAVTVQKLAELAPARSKLPCSSGCANSNPAVSPPAENAPHRSGQPPPVRGAPPTAETPGCSTAEWPD